MKAPTGDTYASGEASLVLTEQACKRIQSDLLEAKGIKTGCLVKTGALIMVVSGVAALILTALVLSGHMSLMTGAWAVFGLVAGVGVVGLFIIGWKQNKCKVIGALAVTAVLLTLAALGGTGVFSISQFGWGYIGTVLGVAFVTTPILDCLDGRMQAPAIRKILDDACMSYGYEDHRALQLAMDEVKKQAWKKRTEDWFVKALFGKTSENAVTTT